MNIALILAGGVGNRVGSVVPKQFIEVKSKPVLVYTLEAFQGCKQIDAICVVANSNWIVSVKNYVSVFNISKVKWIVEGGRTGLESLFNGIKAMKECPKDALILIHDAVRPFITNEVIEDNINVALKHGVAVTSVPCVETLVRIDENNKSVEQISRDSLMRVMTPQTFSYSVLNEILQKEDLKKCHYPSFFSLYMSKGFPVYCSHGSERNIKITYPEDLEYLKKLF